VNDIKPKPMQFEQKKPCASCPFRKDATRAMWVPGHYQMLLDGDQPFGHLFGCHKYRHQEQKHYCAGWMLDQRERGFPNLTLRLDLVSREVAVEVIDAYHDGGHELFESIEELAAYNGVPVPEGDERVQCVECGFQGLRSWFAEACACPSCGEEEWE